MTAIPESWSNFADQVRHVGENAHPGCSGNRGQLMFPYLTGSHWTDANVSEAVQRERDETMGRLISRLWRMRRSRRRPKGLR
jgi:hypothetical protein